VTRHIELLAPQAARSRAGLLSRLHRAVFADDPWDPKAISDIAGLVGFFGLIAWADAEPVGLALVFGPGAEYEIAALGVLPERCRAGFGSALLDAVCAEARGRGARSIVLEVAADNAAARALYVARGFVSAGRRRNYYKRAGLFVDAQLLRLTLVASSPSI
jgi:[ribosomal protein S18]-alanine N-acetyltransferase